MTVTSLAEQIIAWGTGFGVKVPMPMAKLIARKAYVEAAGLNHAAMLELEKVLNPVPPEKIVYVPDSSAYPNTVEFAEIVTEGNHEYAVKKLWENLHEWMRNNYQRLVYEPELTVKAAHEPWHSYAKDANKIKVIMVAKVLPLAKEPPEKWPSYSYNKITDYFPKASTNGGLINWAKDAGMITYKG